MNNHHWENTLRVFGYQVCVIVYFIGIAIIHFPILRFAKSQLNVLFFIMIMLLPLVIMGIGLSFKTRRTKLWAILPAIPAILFSMLALAVYIGGLDESCSTEKVETLDIKHSQVIAYFTECPEPGQGRMVFHQERRIFPGILLMKELYAEEFQEMRDIPQVEMRMITENTVSINFTKQQEITVEIKKFVYF